MNFNFEGTINGMHFTDVDEFNQALAELKKSNNNNISLSYQTSWGDEKTKETTKKGIKNGLYEFLNQFISKEDKKNINHFDIDSLSVPYQKVVNLLDSLDGTIRDEKIIDDLSESLYDVQQMLEYTLSDLDDHDRKDCLKLLENEKSEYDEFLTETTRKGEELQKTIDQLSRKMNTLYSAQNLLKMITKWQEDLIERLRPNC